MAFNDGFENLVLKGVTTFNNDELGRGAYGRVYKVKYCETVCAAKEIHSILIEGVGRVEMQRTVESFLRECRQCSKLRHPNVIQFLGVYYPTGTTNDTSKMRLPVMVMEMMTDSLTSFVEKHANIPGHIKYSIVHDVSLGLCYLHNHDPPIVHRDLSPNNVLLTAHHVAKISDLGVAKVIKADSKKTMTKAPGTVDFMPPEALSTNPVYGPPMDVFSFAGIILHTFNQEWPRPVDQVQFDLKTRKMVALSEVERRQQYLDKMTGEAEELRPLVEKCLDYDPSVRPTIATVCERIQVSKCDIRSSAQNIITLHQQVKQLREETTQHELEMKKLRDEIEQQNSTIGKQRATIEQMSHRTKNVIAEQIASQLYKIPLEEKSANESKLRIEAPPLLPTLTNNRYHIKWTQLSELPVPLLDIFTAVQHNKIYVTGESSIKDIEHQVFLYNINTDHWSMLPPSGHYYGIPCIIGGKLNIIGGRLSATKSTTNKTSTFDEIKHTWVSYHPDMLSVRSKPGVVTHSEHVIVAGGVTDTGSSPVVQDDIEVLNWVENLHWSKVSFRLPVPMYSFAPTISNDHLTIVGYTGADLEGHRRAYQIAIANIMTTTESTRLRHKLIKSSKWTELTSATHWYTTLVPKSSPPVVIGGEDQSDTTADIKVYDNSKKIWKKIGSLTAAKSTVAAAAVHDNAIVVIGGCTKGGNRVNAVSSNLNVVELGQVEILY